MRRCEAPSQARRRRAGRRARRRATPFEALEVAPEFSAQAHVDAELCRKLADDVIDTHAPAHAQFAERRLAGKPRLHQRHGRLVGTWRRRPLQNASSIRASSPA